MAEMSLHNQAVLRYAECMSDQMSVEELRQVFLLILRTHLVFQSTAHQVLAEKTNGSLVPLSVDPVLWQAFLAFAREHQRDPGELLGSALALYLGSRGRSLEEGSHAHS